MKTLSKGFGRAAKVRRGRHSIYTRGGGKKKDEGGRMKDEVKASSHPSSIDER
jgi:hypothetical protein